MYLKQDPGYPEKQYTKRQHPAEIDTMILQGYDNTNNEKVYRNLCKMSGFKTKKMNS